MGVRMRAVAVRVEVLGHDHGHWCNRCLLSTGIRAWVAVGLGNRLSAGIRFWCHQCGGRDVTPAGDVSQP